MSGLTGLAVSVTTADCCYGISALGCYIVRGRYVNPDIDTHTLSEISPCASHRF